MNELMNEGQISKNCDYGLSRANRNYEINTASSQCYHVSFTIKHTHTRFDYYFLSLFDFYWHSHLRRINKSHERLWLTNWTLLAWAWSGQSRVHPRVLLLRYWSEKGEESEIEGDLFTFGIRFEMLKASWPWMR